MTGEARELDGLRAYFCSADGAPIAAERDAADILGEVFSEQARLVVIPVARLGSTFLDLSSRLAGEVLQKFVNYGIRVAIIGDIDEAVAASGALRDFVRESNRGDWVWFLHDETALTQKVARRP